MTDSQRYLGDGLGYYEIRDNFRPDTKEYFSRLTGKTATIASTLKAIQKLETEANILRREIDELEGAFDRSSGPESIAIKLNLDARYEILNNIYIYGDLNTSKLKEKLVSILLNKVRKIRFELQIQKKKSVSASENELMSFPFEQLLRNRDISMLNRLSTNKTRIPIKEFWKEYRQI